MSLGCKKQYWGPNDSHVYGAGGLRNLMKTAEKCADYKKVKLDV